MLLQNRSRPSKQVNERRNHTERGMIGSWPCCFFCIVTMFSVGRASAFFSRASVSSGRRGRTKMLLTSASVSGGSLSETIRLEAEDEMAKLQDLYEGRSDAPTILMSQEEASAFVQQNIDAALFDCDGVLYRTPVPIPGAKECIESMMKEGKKVLFVTNNAGVNRKQLREKLSKILDVDSLVDEQMISASYSAAQFLKNEVNCGGMTGKRVHVIGSGGLCEELKSFGFEVSGGPSSDKPEMDRGDLASYEFPESPIDAIVVGHDVAFTFRKLSIANVLLQKNPLARFVATNRDSFDLVGGDGRHIPGNGCIVAALEYCSRRTALNTGKPSKDLLGVIQQEHNLDLSRTMFVGDRLDTDIKFGKDTGMISVLVMTGVTTADKLASVGEGNDEEPLPTIVVSHVGKLVR